MAYPESRHDTCRSTCTIPDLARKHIYENVNFRGLELLLEYRTGWSNDASENINTLFDLCPASHTGLRATASRKLPVTNLNLSLNCNDTVFFDDPSLRGVRILNAVNSLFLYVLRMVCGTTIIEKRICQLETLWSADFWSPSELQCD